jgi:hypothetical protein
MGRLDLIRLDLIRPDLSRPDLSGPDLSGPGPGQASLASRMRRRPHLTPRSHSAGLVRR